MSQALPPAAAEDERETGLPEAALPFTDRAFRILIWIVLYAIPAVAATRPVTDWDIWWHLRTGQWLVDNGSVPTRDPFSLHERDKPWVAYSWLFELLVYGLHQALGLWGIIIYRIVLSVAIVAAIHRLVARREPRFLVSTGLVGLAVIACIPLFNERPWLFTILFSTLTLDAVLALREGRATRAVWLLPLAYVIWANVHIQFIYGLFILGLACVAPLIDSAFRRAEAGAAGLYSPGWWRLVALSAACAIATLVNPYHLRLYWVVVEYATQPGPFQVVLELRALEFREPWDWVMLLLVGMAAFALGRRPAVSAFDVLLLVASVAFAFRARRDIWFATVVSVAILARSHLSVPVPADRFAMTWLRGLAVVLAVAAAVVLAAWARALTPSHLDAEVAKKYPVEAAAHVEAHRYPGPLYNHFNWGGYLIWRLPQLPVAIDGRTNLYGDEWILRFEDTWKGLAGWEKDPDLDSAGVVIAYSTPKDARPGEKVPYALPSLLRLDPRFELVHEDDVGLVFVRRGRGAGAGQKAGR
jgi:hypothetical protein